MVKTNNLVKVISRVRIKPSFPTPSHLRKMKRSYLDTILIPMYVPLIFFYPKPVDQYDHDEDATMFTPQRLKESLARTLTSFYPLAGRIQDTFTIDCNDSGVVFIEARVRAQLKDSIQDPNTEEDLKDYLPSTEVHDDQEPALFLVQINLFDCGGIAVGVHCSHQIADCASIMAFIKAWAGAASTSTTAANIISPSFDLANYFPGRELPSSEGSSWEPFLTNEKFTTKRFVFDEEKLSALRGIHAADDDVSKEHMMRPATRVELVSAFIWKTLMTSAESNNNNHSSDRAIFTAYHGVNLRPRKSPPQLLENAFGNCVVSAYSFSDTTDEFPQLVRKLRNAIQRIDNDYITESQSGDIFLNDMCNAFSTTAKAGTGHLIGFSSWCRFPVYEVDFGWGMPVWVCTAALPVKDIAVLVNSRCGEGIEAWVNMEQHNLDILHAKLMKLV